MGHMRPAGLYLDHTGLTGVTSIFYTIFRWKMKVKYFTKVQQLSKMFTKEVVVFTM